MAARQKPKPTEPGQEIAIPDSVTTAVRKARQWVQDIEVTDQGSMAAATSIAATIKEQRDKAEEARTFLVKPLNDHVRNINATFKPHIEALDAATAAVKAKIRDYVVAEQAKAEAERQRLQEEAEARAAARSMLEEREVEPVQVEAAPAPRAATDVGSSSISKRWTYEVTDLQKLCAAIGRGDLPVDLVEPNRGHLNRVATNAEVRGSALALLTRIADRDGLTQEGAMEALGLKLHQVTDVSIRRQ